MAIYSDQEMLVFSDIAYKDLSKYDQCVANKSKYSDGKVPIKDILSPSEISEISKEYGIDAATIGNWKIASRPGDSNGFYGCIIETEPGQAAVAFRGSESMFNPEAAMTDWLSNMQLLNSSLTDQQAEVNKFLEKNKELLQSYDHIGITGHSLGGNLAEYATIVSDNFGLADKVDQCTNLDGPGFNQEFIAIHQQQIAKMRDKITHYQWSAVGSIFNSQIGNIKYADTEDVSEFPWELKQHDRKYVLINSDGSIKTRDSIKGDLATFIKEVTENLDNMPEWYRDLVLVTFGAPLLAGLVTIGTIIDFTTDVFDEIHNGYDALINWNADRIEDFVNGWNSFWDMVLGRNEDLTPEQIAANTAKAECETTPGFVICPAVYVALAEATQKLSTELDEVTSILRGMGDLTSPAKWAVKTVSNPHGSSKVANVNKQISNKAGEMAGIIRGVSSCYSEISSTKNTVDGIAGYLYYTGNGILEIENEAKRMVSLWDTPPT